MRRALRGAAAGKSKPDLSKLLSANSEDSDSGGESAGESTARPWGQGRARDDDPTMDWDTEDKSGALNPPGSELSDEDESAGQQKNPDDDSQDEDVFGDGAMDTDEQDDSVDDINITTSPKLSPLAGGAQPRPGANRSPGRGAAPEGKASEASSSSAASSKPSAEAEAPKEPSSSSSSSSTSTSSAAGKASSSASSASASEASGQDSSAPPPLALGDGEPPKLAFLIRGSVLSHDTTIFDLVQRHGRTQPGASGGDDEPRSFTPATRGMWSDVYELQYCRESSLTEAQKSADAVLRGPDASAAGSGEAGLSDRTLALALTNDIGLKERSLDSIRDLLVMLRLSSWLMTPSRRRQLGLRSAVAEAAAGSGMEQAEILDSTLSGKVLRQLQDPLSLCAGMPGWIDALMRACPYVFSFECKHQYFSCTQLGLSRALSRLQAAEQAAGLASPRQGAAAEPRHVSLRIQRQKVRISRTRILESATKVLDLYGSNNKAMLEVEFFGEVGTGLGPTLEFYTISSRELQRKSLKLWRAGLNEKVGEEFFAPSEFGLFPAPLPLSSRKVAHVSGDGGSIRAAAKEGRHAVLDRFRLLGRLMGKALQDNRLLDIHLSPLLCAPFPCPWNIQAAPSILHTCTIVPPYVHVGPDRHVLVLSGTSFSAAPRPPSTPSSRPKSSGLSTPASTRPLTSSAPCWTRRRLWRLIARWGLPPSDAQSRCALLPPSFDSVRNAAVSQRVFPPP